MTIKTLIIIPCYNEAERLDTKACLTFARTAPQTRILFVNDGSTDATASILNQIAAGLPDNISVLHLGKNMGKAEAVRRGFLHGFTLDPQFIAYLDADLAAPFSAIQELESTLIRNAKDIAIGARVALLGWNIQRNTSRHYAGRVFATAASMILGLRIYDTQCGAKLFRVTNRLKNIFAAPFNVRWIFDVEILARFIITEKSGYPRAANICIEYPLQEWIDQKGSKLRLKDFFISAFDLVKIAIIIQKKSLPGQ